MNQVISDSLSSIDGHLKANGHVYLVNPNEILIGPTGKIQAGRFVAACLGVSEFLSDSEMHFTKDKKAGDLIHMGEIVSDNEIYLIAKTIDSIGKLKGKIVGLIGTEDVFLKEKNEVLGWVHIKGEGGLEPFRSYRSNSGSTISSTGTGVDAANITLNGRGTAAAGSGAVGVLVGFTSDVTTVDGNISLIGLSAGTANFNYGIHLFQDVDITSSGTGANAGTITFNGTGSSGRAENHGVRMELSTIVSSVEGNVGITGLSNGTSNFNQGLSMDTDTEIISAGTGDGAALITINSTSGTGLNENHGITMSASTIGSTDGNINVTTTSRGTSTDNHVILLSESGLIISKGLGVDAADIDINATPGAGSIDNIGVIGDNTSNVTSAAGTINIIGGFLLDTN